MSNRPFENRRQACDVTITPQGSERNILLGDPDLSDLRGYGGAIRSRWWRAYREDGIESPIVVAVHKRSRLAMERNLSHEEDFSFVAVSPEEAANLGWIVDTDRSNRPPTMLVYLATGEEVQGHIICDMTPTGMLDKAHFDTRARERLLKGRTPDEKAALKSLIEEPWRTDVNVL